MTRAAPAAYELLGRLDPTGTGACLDAPFSKHMPGHAHTHGRRGREGAGRTRERSRNASARQFIPPRTRSKSYRASVTGNATTRRSSKATVRIEVFYYTDALCRYPTAAQPRGPPRWVVSSSALSPSALKLQRVALRKPPHEAHEPFPFRTALQHEDRCHASRPPPLK